MILSKRHSKLISINRIPNISTNDIENVVTSLYSSRYFTNHGPLAKKFEDQLQSVLDIENVVTFGNESLALLAAIACLNPNGKIAIPIFPDQIPLQICSGAGYETTPYDLNRYSLLPNADELNHEKCRNLSAAVWIEPWGIRGSDDLLLSLAEGGLKVILIAFDSLLSFTEKARAIHKHPNIVTVFSFASDKLVTTLQGGAISTSDSLLAEKFRNMRSSYGMRKKVDVMATCNGRFSEAQAGIGIRSLERAAAAKRHCRQIQNQYCNYFATANQHFSLVDDASKRQLCESQWMPLLAHYSLSNSEFPFDSLPDHVVRFQSIEQHWSSVPNSVHLSNHLILLPTGPNVSQELARMISESLSKPNRNLNED